MNTQQQPWIGQYFLHRVDGCRAIVGVVQSTRTYPRNNRGTVLIQMAQCDSCNKYFKVAEEVGDHWVLVGEMDRASVIAHGVRLEEPTETAVVSRSKKLKPSSSGGGHAKVKERRRATQRRFAEQTRRTVAWRGGVLHFVDDHGAFTAPVPGAPAIPFPGKRAHGEGGPRAWPGAEYLSDEERQQARRNPGYIDWGARPAPAPTIGGWGNKVPGKHGRRW